MIKKTRNTLTDLLQEVDLNNLKEPPIDADPVKPDRVQKKAKPTKINTKTEPSSQTILDRLKAETPEKNTRITIDLDPETYALLKELVKYTGKTQAKLIRALITETAKLLHKTQ